MNLIYIIILIKNNNKIDQGAQIFISYTQSGIFIIIIHPKNNKLPLQASFRKQPCPLNSNL